MDSTIQHAVPVGRRIASRIPPGLGLAFGVSASLFLVGLVGQAGFGRLPPKIYQNLKIMKTNSKRNQKTRMIFVSILWPSWLNFWSQVGSVLRFFFMIMFLGRPQGDFGREPRPILLSRRQVLEPFGGSCRSQIVIFLTSFLRSLLR